MAALQARRLRRFSGLLEALEIDVEIQAGLAGGVDTRDERRPLHRSESLRRAVTRAEARREGQKQKPTRDVSSTRSSHFLSIWVSCTVSPL